MAQNIFQLTDGLSSQLQNSNMSCADAGDIVQAVVGKLQQYRADDFFERFYKDVIAEANNLGKYVNCKDFGSTCEKFYNQDVDVFD